MRSPVGREQPESIRFGQFSPKLEHTFRKSRANTNDESLTFASQRRQINCDPVSEHEGVTEKKKRVSELLNVPKASSFLDQRGLSPSLGNISSIKAFDFGN